MDKRAFISKAVVLRRLSQSVASSYMTDPDDIEDAVQDVMLRLWERHDCLIDDDERLKGYVKILMRNICLDRQKAMRRHPSTSLFCQHDNGSGPRVIHEVASDDNPQHSLETREARDITMSALDRLPQNWKAIIKMRSIEGMSFSDIASILGTSESSVRGTLSKARKKLLELIKIVR